MSSRIVVKNLPKHLKEDRFKDHFSKQGHVTDVKIMKRADGTSRRFGYIGFKTEKEAKAAVRYFNQTFIDTSKIEVEVAKPIGDPSLPKPWSKISLEKQQREEEVLKNQEAAQKKQSEKEEEVQNAIEAKKNHISLLYQAEGDEKLKEYLEIMQPRAQAKTWANEDTAILGHKIKPAKNVKAKVLAVANKKTGGQGQMLTKTHLTFDDEEDELYDDLPVNEDQSNQEGEMEEIVDEVKRDGVVFDNTVSDLDYLKSKMKGSTVEETVVQTEAKPVEETPSIIEPRKEPELSPESQIMDNGRLFIRNLSYTCTENDLRKAFEKFGPLSEVHMPISKETSKPKGFAYVLYLLPEHALAAFKKLDNSFFQGRLLHILPSKDKLVVVPDFDNENLSIKKRNELKKKAMSTSDYNWNSLFMSTDSIAASIAERLGITKGEVLDPTADDVATRLATAETQIIMETKLFFEEHGIELSSFSKKERSDTVILVKNIPYGTSEDQIKELFGKHGQLGRVLIPPSKTIAVVEFLQPTEARAAFRHLAYKRFGDAPLYLEKGPGGMFKDSFSEIKAKAESKDKVDESPKETTNTEDPTTVEQPSDLSESVTLFVKNLSFNTTKQSLHDAFKHLAGLKSVTIKTKPDTKNPGQTLSMGFGFAEFDNKSNATIAMKIMQNFSLDEHALEIKLSNKQDPGQKEVNAKTSAPKGTKILVKNIPFEATKRDIRELFSTFGQLKSVRLPSKFSGGHRGFGFLEFLTAREAKNVMDNVANTHLYGRHLVLQYAEDESNIEEMREKVARQFAKDEEGAPGKKRRVLMPGEEEEMEE